MSQAANKIIPTLASTIIYPDSDGKPMAENTRQYQYIITIQVGLDGLFASDPDVFVSLRSALLLRTYPKRTTGLSSGRRNTISSERSGSSTKGPWDRYSVTPLGNLCEACTGSTWDS